MHFSKLRHIKGILLCAIPLLILAAVLAFWRPRPQVSILMPVYNGESHLRRALNSALRQTLKRIEIVCVDDGSTDQSAKILGEFAARDRRIRIFRNGTNKGTFCARLRAMAAAKGSYVLWLDADDELFPDIARRARAVAKKSGADCVHFCTECVKDGTRALAGAPLDPQEGTLDGDELLPALCGEASVWFIWNKMYDGKIIRRAAEKLMPYADKGDIVYVEDLPILWNAWRETNKCVGISDIGYRHYLAAGLSARIGDDASCKRHLLMNSAQAAAIVVDQEKESPTALDLAKKVRSVAARRFLRVITTLPIQDGVNLFRSYMAKFPDEMQFEIFSAMLEQSPPWATAAANRMKFPRRARSSDDGKISIVLRIPTLAIGGVERVVSLLANHWANDPRYHVSLVIDKNAAVTYTVDPAVRLLRISPASSGHSYNEDWRSLAQEIPMDVCICINYGNWFNYPILKFLGIPMVAQEHNFYFRSLFLDKGTMLWRKLTYAGCSAVSCLSQMDLFQWREDGVRNSLILNNPLTFDPDDIVPSDHSSKNVLWIGRWTEDAKRPHLAIETFAKVLQRVPDAKLLMIGTAIGKDRPYRDRCLKRIEELGIGYAIEVLSFRDVAPYYRDGALLMMTSSIEGAPMVITEAKAHAIPVVLMRLGYLDGAKVGCIQTEKNDVDALAEAVAQLLEDRERRIALGRDGAEDVRKNYSNGSAFKKYEALIDAVMAGPDAVAAMCSAELLPDALAAKRVLGEEERALAEVIYSLKKA